MALAKIDSKGRVSLPRDMHEMFGDTVELKTMGKQGVLLSRVSKSKSVRRKKDNNSFTSMLDSEPRRTGEPENPSPEEMKSIWNE